MNKYRTAALILLLLLSTTTYLNSNSSKCSVQPLETELIELKHKIELQSSFSKFKMLQYFDEESREKAFQICEKFNLNIEDLLLLFKIESGGNPKAFNKKSGATGLIQWLPKTAVGFGVTTAAIKNMSTLEQLNLVEMYLDHFKPEWGYKDFVDLYLAVFHPAALGKHDDFVIGAEGSKAVLQNANVDKDKNGILTVADVKTFIN